MQSHFSTDKKLYIRKFIPKTENDREFLLQKITKFY